MAPPDEASAPGGNYWTLYTSPRGRIPRSIYWQSFWLPITIMSVGAELLDRDGLFGLVALCLYTWPGIVGSVKRLHDIDVSLGRWVAWWAFGAGVVVLAVVLASVIPFSGDLAGLSVAAFIPLFVLNIKLFFFRGTQGLNRYGPDPLEEDWEDHILPLDWRRLSK